MGDSYPVFMTFMARDKCSEERISSQSPINEDEFMHLARHTDFHR